MKTPLRFFSVALLVAVTAPAGADIVVLANRARSVTRLTVRPAEGRPVAIRLAAGDVTSLSVRGPVQVDVTRAARSGAETYRLLPNRCYYLGETQRGAVKLAQIALPHGDRAGAVRRWSHGKPPARSATIRVKILVDDDEPGRRRMWEPRLRRRIAVASEILVRHGAPPLEVVAVATWDTNDAVSDFGRALTEFEAEVDPSPALVAIGFTSQYRIPDGRTHLGGTRGPLASHILVREWSQHIPEPQRVELVLHELGHFLGAAHSPEPGSVMRPVLVGRETRSKHFPLRLDPLNTLAISLVGEEIRFRRVRDFSRITPETSAILLRIYEALARAMPDDPTAWKYGRILTRQTL